MSNTFAAACMKVGVAVENIDDKHLYRTLIREGVKFWLGKMSPNEIEQIARMEMADLQVYVAQHALDDINTRYDADPDAPES